MTDPAKSRGGARSGLLLRLVVVCLLSMGLAVMWDRLGLVDSTAGMVICELVTIALVVPTVLLWPVFRWTRRGRHEEQMLRAARKVAAVASPPERAEGRQRARTASGPARSR